MATEPPAAGFPRGQVSTGLTRAAPWPRANQPGAFLFRAISRKRASATARKTDKSKVELSQPVAAKAMKTPRKILPLTHARLAAGMSLLGQVVDITAAGLTLSLPNNLVGYVSYVDISDRHTCGAAAQTSEKANVAVSLPQSRSVVRVGALLRCTVIGVAKTRGHGRINLSTRASLINAGLSAKSLVPGLTVAGTIDSTEDHGYTVDLGVAGASGFIAYADADCRQWLVGRPVQCIIKKLTRRATSQQVVHLAAIENELKEVEVGEFAQLSLCTLQAGMLVRARVATISSGGAVLAFLRHFVGTVDSFHLPDGKCPTPQKQTEVAARILYVDPVNKFIGLSLKSHLVSLEGMCLPATAAVGTVFEAALVEHVNPVLGLHLQLPGVRNCMGFAHISRISDAHIEKIGHEYSVGTRHSCRVVSHSPLDCVVNVSMQASVLGAPFLRISEIGVGAAVTGNILAVKPYGILVTLSDRVTGLCPAIHLGEMNVINPISNFQPGMVVRCIVLSVDIQNNRVILSMKKSLRTSQLPRIVTFADAKVGGVYEGWISAIKGVGCIVSFFNNVHGLLPNIAASNTDVQNDEFRLGQTLKVQVVRCIPAAKKLVLTIEISSEPSTDRSALQQDHLIGTLIGGTVTRKSATELTLRLDGGNAMFGQLHVEHMSDHQDLCGDLLLGYQIGQRIERMLVLKIHIATGQAFMSLKSSLQDAASSGTMPPSFDNLCIGASYAGFVSNVTKFGVFVTLSATLTGLAAKANVADEFVSDPARYFNVGQSVLARVHKVDQDKQKFQLSLKKSDCSSSYLYLSSYFIDLCTIAGVNGKGYQWYKDLRIGEAVEGVVEDIRFGGIVVNLGGDVTGFVKQEHCTTAVSTCIGDTVTAVVLDADPRNAIVDLSLLPRFLCTKTLSAVKADVGCTVRGTVQLVKREYLVLALESGLICFTNRSINDGQPLNAKQMYKFGHTVTAQLVRAPGENGRLDSASPHVLVAFAKNLACSEIAAKSRKRQKKFALNNDVMSMDDIQIGMRTIGQIHKIHKSHMSIILGPKVPGRVHITEAVCEETNGDNRHVFSKYKVGERVKTRVLSVIADGVRGQLCVDLSLRPSTLASEDIYPRASFESLACGQTFFAPIENVQADQLWVSLSREVKGRVLVVDAVSDITIAVALDKYFQRGCLLRCKVLAVDTARKTVDLSAMPLKDLSLGHKCLGLITRIRSGDAMYVQLPGLRHGRVHITDTHDIATEHPFKTFQVGQLITCVIVGTPPNGLLDLSVQPSVLSGQLHANGNSDVKSVAVGQRVHGYVRAISKQGCFVNLGRALVGRVVLRELSTSFVADLTGQFPVGKLVCGVVTSLAADTGRVELSLKSQSDLPSSKQLLAFADLKVGAKYSCSVRRVEPFGIFLSVNSSNCVGLCHTSELSDDGNNVAIYLPGDYVQAVVLALNDERQQISFGLKPSYFAENDVSNEQQGAVLDEPVNGNGSERKSTTGSNNFNSNATLALSPGAMRSIQTPL